MTLTVDHSPKILSVSPVISIRVLPTVAEINNRIIAKYESLRRVLPALPQWVALALACDHVKRQIEGTERKPLRLSDREFHDLDNARDNLTDDEIGQLGL